MRALVLEKQGDPLVLKEIPTPKPVHGSIIVKILSANLEPGMKTIISGERGFGLPHPCVPGARAVGRIAMTGPDTTSLREGQLVLVDPFVRARDDPNVFGLLGAFDGSTPDAKKWFADNWRNGTWAEYVRVLLENCWPLNEKILCEDLGYSIFDLNQLNVQAVAIGGLRSIDLKAGETIVVAPATGLYSGAAVVVADAIGANIVAVGRNIEVLKKLEATFPRVKAVQIKGNVEEDTAAISKYGPIDAYADISPPQAMGTTHIRSCFKSLAPYGRVSLMGGFPKDLDVDYVTLLMRSLTIRGSAMYDRADVKLLIKLAESGNLKLARRGGQEVIGKYSFEEVEKDFDNVLTSLSAGQMKLLVP
ncbi:MAG: hypothetical protein Q9227_000632 [Pyrenula ochraceoflavens]